MWIYRVSCPLLPRGYIDADRVARDGGFAVERLDLGLREPERREQRGAKVELAGAIAVAVELGAVPGEWHQRLAGIAQPGEMHGMVCEIGVELRHQLAADRLAVEPTPLRKALACSDPGVLALAGEQRSEEHTSELQSLMRISYAVFCLKKKK